MFLIPSYYAGWMKGEYYFDEKMAYVNCYSLTHGTECLNPLPFHGMEPAFALVFEKRVTVGRFFYTNKILEEALRSEGLYTDEILILIKIF